MKIVVVGGAGYVGCVTSSYLQGQAHEVKVIDRMLYAPTKPPSSILTSDIRNLNPDDLEGFDAVINLAGFSNDPTAEFDPEANKQLNTIAAVDLMRTAAAAGIKRYVLASSASVYDGCVDQDMASENSDLIPSSEMYPYSQSKVNAERLLAAVAGELGLSLVVLRKGTIHGFSPRMRYDLIVNAMVGSAVRNNFVTCHTSTIGPMYRPIVDVRDVARAYEKACLFQLPDGLTETFNICSENLSVLEIAAVVVSATQDAGLSTRLNLAQIPDDRKVRSYRMSARRAAAILDWHPKYQLCRSLDDLIYWVQDAEAGIFDPRTSNIEWMRIVRWIEDCTAAEGSILTGEAK